MHTNERKRREQIIRRFQKGQLDPIRAARLLGCTTRHVYRLADKLSATGSLAHCGLGHPAANRLDEDTEQAVLACFDANPHRNNQQVADLLAEAGLTTNRMTVKRILERHGRQRHPQPRPAFIRFEHDSIGAVVYQDTSEHQWLLAGGQRLHCIASQDDHSRKLLFARFFRHDGVWQNMVTLRYVVETFGLPQTFFVDRASHFAGYQHQPDHVRAMHPEADEVQIRRAVESLGVPLSHSTAYHPQSKGKLERLFGFMQGRLPHELPAASLVEANKRLIKWTYWYNAKHQNRTTGMTPERRWSLARRNKRSLFVPVPGSVDLDDVFSCHDRRVIAKDNTFTYQGETYRLERVGGQYIGKQVELHVVPPRKIRVWWLGTFVCELPFKGTFKHALD